MSDQPDKAKPTHVGQIVRALREAAGLSRNDIEQLTGIAADDLSEIEEGLGRPLGWALDALLKLPAMADLPSLAHQAGLVLDVGDSSVDEEPTDKRQEPAVTKPQWQQFGRLVKDKRHAAGLSRMQLARKAKLSDSTIKFLETARHPPSRATLIRLVETAELKLRWADVPGRFVPPAAESSEAAGSPAQGSWLHDHLNYFVAPSYDALALVADLGRFLNGAGGHVEQTGAYLDHHSAAAYLAICQNSPAAVGLRSSIPLAKAAKQIRAASGPMALQVLALGAGDGVLEARLAQHLLDEQILSVDLCLVDISQPLLNCAYRHAADSLTAVPNAKVWGVQCDFHHLPLYTGLYLTPAGRPKRRLFCMLGGTLANLDQEPRFLRQSLLNCESGDLLLLDIQLASAPTDQPSEIRRRDKLFSSGVPAPYAAWLGGPIWRHCREVASIEFTWDLETHCPVPGSYALLAMATVKSSSRADRRFSMFRFSRYDPISLAGLLSSIGWQEIGAIAYAGEHSLRLYQKREEGLPGST